MYGGLVLKDDNPQNAVVHLGNSFPQADAPVGLNLAFLRVVQHLTNPLVPDDRPVGPGPCVQKISGELHLRVGLAPAIVTLSVLRAEVESTKH